MRGERGKKRMSSCLVNKNKKKQTSENKRTQTGSFRLARNPRRSQRPGVYAVCTRSDRSGFPGIVLVSGSTFQHRVT